MKKAGRPTRLFSYMAAKLAEPLRRKLELKGQAYTLTVTGEGFTLVANGKRKGVQMPWADVVSGDAALAVRCRRRRSEAAHVIVRGSVAIFPGSQPAVGAIRAAAA